MTLELRTNKKSKEAKGLLLTKRGTSALQRLEKWKKQFTQTVVTKNQ